MSTKSRVTVKDVARLAGVSPGTVSNALSGKRPVSEQTRTRILAVIDELDYHPNLLARGLVSRQSHTLAVVASGLEYYGPSRTLVGMEDAATRLGYSLLLDLVPLEDGSQINDVLTLLTGRRVDGIVWAVHEIGNNRDWVTEERLAQLPPVVFLAMKPRPGLDIVGADNRHGARLATEHLIEQGRRNIGMITGPLTWWEARERVAAWHETMRDHGLPATDAQLVEGNWSAVSGEQGLAQLLSQHPRMDGLVVSNDQMALGVLRTAHTLGLRVPEDLAVVGYDNIPDAAYFWPALTSVRQHLVDVGRLAVERLHSLIAARFDGDDAQDSLVQLTAPELIVRESSTTGASTIAGKDEPQTDTDTTGHGYNNISTDLR